MSDIDAPSWDLSLKELLAKNIKRSDIGTTFMGDFTKYAMIEISFFGYEFSLLFVLQLVFFIVMMTRLNGRFLRMSQWLHALEFQILGNTIKPQALIAYLSIVGYSYLTLPFVTLVFWTSFLVKDATDHGRKLDLKNPVFMGAISVFLLGIAAVLMLLVFTKISWNNYRFKASHFVLLVVGLVCFTAWQFVIMFSSIGDGEFAF